MSQSAVNRAEMQKAVGQIDEAQGNIHGTQSRLKSEVTSLMAGWQGIAASAYLKAYEEFDMQFEKVHQALVGLQEELGQTQRTYTQVEDDQKAATNAIFQALN